MNLIFIKVMEKLNITTQSLPGRTTEKLATINLSNQGSGSCKCTPEWLISFDKVSAGLAAGTLALRAGIGIGVTRYFMGTDPIMAGSSEHNLQAFTELFGWNSETVRFTGGHTSGALLPSASVQFSPLTIMIPSGNFAANAEKAMFNGTLIKAITIIRTGFIAGSLQIVQTVVFRDCRILKFQQQLDRLIMHFSILEKETKMFVFDENGRPCGLTMGTNNIEKNDTSSPLNTVGSEVAGLVGQATKARKIGLIEFIIGVVKEHI
ncbi:MAG: hypothetical protein LBF84_03325 [Holosporales bacterium]|jgi:hypothetical protein|nr:hypothetical protein [Holosporales bacterium]